MYYLSRLNLRFLCFSRKNLCLILSVIGNDNDGDPIIADNFIEINLSR